LIDVVVATLEYGQIKPTIGSEQQQKAICAKRVITCILVI
jgi:hypothetical protein